LLVEVDAVVVATPTPSHYSIAKTALESGSHVLLEKPMTLSIEEAEDLIQRAKANSLVLQVGFVERYRLKALVEENPKITWLESHRNSQRPGRDRSTDVVEDLMIHDVDLLLSILGTEPVKIEADGFSLVSDRHDVVRARLEFEGGVIAQLNASRVAAIPERSLKVYGEESQIFVDFCSNVVTVSSICPVEGIQHKASPRLEFDALEVQALDFVRSIVRGSEPAVSGEDGLRALKTVKAIQDKINHGREFNHRAAEGLSFQNRGL